MSRWVAILSILLIVSILLVAIGRYFTKSSFLKKPLPEKTGIEVQLSDSDPKALVVPGEFAHKLGIETGTIEAATRGQSLWLNGTITLNPDRFVSVRSRFEGEVIQADGVQNVSVGQQLKKGQLLAVLWSADLGEKKSDYVDALSELHHDSEVLKRLNGIAKSGAIPERQLFDQERIVEADQIAKDRALRKLLVFRSPEEEVKQLEQEAQNIIDGKPTPQDDLVSQWARIELRSPISGTLLEKNVSPGMIAGEDDDLFKIADLSQVKVVANVYEEDLRLLEQLPLDQRGWAVYSAADESQPIASGQFTEIGPIIDPNQRTAFVMGLIENKGQAFRIGQFVRIKVKFPTPSGSLQIPADALLEQGSTKQVFRLKHPDEPSYELIDVQVINRHDDIVHIKETDLVHAGDTLITSGAVELLSRWNELIALQHSHTSKK